MGYTHYWEIAGAKVIPIEAQLILRDILDDAYANHLIQYEHNVSRLPLLTDKVVRFNGVDELGHETFYFNIDDPFRDSHGNPFGFCKTARKPYDTVVMKVLIVLKHFLGEQLQISSDGDFNEEWEEVREEMREKYGITTYVNQYLAA